jgi:hypothetical protein
VCIGARASGNISTSNRMATRYYIRDAIAEEFNGLPQAMRL